MQRPERKRKNQPLPPGEGYHEPWGQGGNALPTAKRDRRRHSLSLALGYRFSSCPNGSDGSSHTVVGSICLHSSAADRRTQEKIRKSLSQNPRPPLACFAASCRSRACGADKIAAENLRQHLREQRSSPYHVSLSACGRLGIGDESNHNPNRRLLSILMNVKSFSTRVSSLVAINLKTDWEEL